MFSSPRRLIVTYQYAYKAAVPGYLARETLPYRLARLIPDRPDPAQAR